MQALHCNVHFRIFGGISEAIKKSMEEMTTADQGMLADDLPEAPI
jgi:hypothetical protein